MREVSGKPNERSFHRPRVLCSGCDLILRYYMTVRTPDEFDAEESVPTVLPSPGHAFPATLGVLGESLTVGDYICTKQNSATNILSTQPNMTEGGSRVSLGKSLMH
jgi:hypothetical protein